MKSYISYNSCTPCSGDIGDIYSDSIEKYQKLVQEERNKVNALLSQLTELRKDKREKSEECAAIQEKNEEFEKRVNMLKKVTRTMEKELAKYDKTNVEHTDTPIQVIDEEYIQLKLNNEELQKQILELQEMAHQCVTSQQKLTHNYQKKKNKLKNLRIKSQKFNSQLDDSSRKQDELTQKLSHISAEKDKYKTENTRISIRLTETEGNINEIELMNEKLRGKLKDLSEIQQSNHNDSILNMSSRLYDIETRQAMAEMKLKELTRLKSEFDHIRGKIELRKMQIKQITSEISEINDDK